MAGCNKEEIWNTLMQILSFDILWDNVELSPIAEKNIEAGKIYIPFEVITEIVYVLEGVYNTDRKTIKENILGLLAYPNITTNDIEVLKYAFSIFTKKKLNHGFHTAITCFYQ